MFCLLISEVILYTNTCATAIVYVGRRPSDWKNDTFRQHVSKFIRNQVKPQKDLPRRQCKSTQNAPISDSAIIGQHC